MVQPPNGRPASQNLSITWRALPGIITVIIIIININHHHQYKHLVRWLYDNPHQGRLWKENRSARAGEKGADKVFQRFIDLAIITISTNIVIDTKKSSHLWRSNMSKLMWSFLVGCVLVSTSLTLNVIGKYVDARLPPPPKCLDEMAARAGWWVGLVLPSPSLLSRNRLKPIFVQVPDNC